MSELSGMPTDQIDADVGARSVSVVVEESVYPLDAVYGATYTLIDRCYILLDRVASGRIRVVVTPKKDGASEAELRALAGELANELLSCAWRSQIVRDNRAVVEAVTLQALGGAVGPPTLDELKEFDFSEEPFEDPLGIAVSWEDKYKKKDKEKADEASTSEAAGASKESSR
jgi:His-Xaa-Ser system protein HxsD